MLHRLGLSRITLHYHSRTVTLHPDLLIPKASTESRGSKGSVTVLTLATSSMVNASSSSPTLLTKELFSNQLVPSVQALADHHIVRKHPLTVLLTPLFCSLPRPHSIDSRSQDSQHSSSQSLLPPANSDIGSDALYKDSADQIISLGGFRRPCRASSLLRRCGENAGIGIRHQRYAAASMDHQTLLHRLRSS